MPNLTPVSSFDNVPELETTTLALGGPGGPMNLPMQALLNRTQWLHDNAVAGSAGPFAEGGGTTNAYTATFSPAITALADGLKLRFTAVAVNTDAATFAPNALAAKPIVGGAYAPLQGGEILTNGVAEVVWNSVLDAWVLISHSGALQVPDATESQQAANLGQVAAAAAPKANSADLAADTGPSLIGYKQVGTGAVLRTVLSKLLELAKSPEDFGAVGDGVTDDAVAIIKALAAVALASPSDRGTTGVVDLHDKTFAFASDIQIPTNTIITNGKLVAKGGAKLLLGGATSADIHYYSGLPDVVVEGELSAGVPLSTNLVSVKYLVRGNFINTRGMNALGAGFTTTINTRNCTFQDTYFYNCCQNVAAITGAIELRGSDHVVAGDCIGQATVTSAEITAASAQIPFRVGVLLNCSTSSFGGQVRGEVSGFAGIYVQNSFSCDFGPLLADLNAGHGVYFATNCANFVADVRSSGNNKLNGSYDALHIAAGDVSQYKIRSLLVDELGGTGHPMRAHVYVEASTAVTQRGEIAHPRGSLNGAARFFLPTGCSPVIIEGRHPFTAFTDGDTTPSVDGGTCWKFANTAATTITAFDDGYEGKRITVVGDGNTTLQHPAIITPQGRNYLIGINDVVELVKRPTAGGGAWQVLTQPRKLSTTDTYNFPSIANGASATRVITVTGVALGDLVQVSLDVDVLGLGVSAQVTAANTVTVVLTNATGAAVDLPQANVRVFVTKI